MRRKKAKRRAAMSRAMRFIKTKWRAGKSLKEVAELYGVDAANLERAFHRGEDVTIKQFIDQQRKAYVLSRLAESALYGHEIGTAMGFSNKRVFYRWVKRVFGISFVALRRQGRDKVVTKRDDKK